MSIALDFGASTIVSLRRTGERLIARSSRLEYAVLPDSPAHRRLLERRQVSFLTCESDLVLAGDAAHENADLFRTPCRPLLVDGRVPENDPLARQVIAQLAESVLPPAQVRDDICAVTLPGDVTLDGSDTRSDFEFLTRIIRLQGYEPLLVPSGQALVLAELVRSAFTGTGLTFGHAGCEALLAIVERPCVMHRQDWEENGWISSCSHTCDRLHLVPQRRFPSSHPSLVRPTSSRGS